MATHDNQFEQLLSYVFKHSSAAQSPSLLRKFWTKALPRKVQHFARRQEAGEVVTQTNLQHWESERHYGHPDPSQRCLSYFSLSESLHRRGRKTWGKPSSRRLSQVHVITARRVLIDHRQESLVCQAFLVEQDDLPAEKYEYIRLKVSVKWPDGQWYPPNMSHCGYSNELPICWQFSG